MITPRLLAAGDTALTVELGATAALGLSLGVLELDRRIAAARLPGVVEVVPAIRSLTVHYDPCRTSQQALREALAPLVADVAARLHVNADDDPETATGAEGGQGYPIAAPARRWLIPACYEPPCAPDTETVAAACGLSAWQVGALHACVAYRVLMVGFLPGHPYMGELPPPLRLPRRTTPRTSVPPGSIAIATTMTVIYPQESPGGWHIIARTPVRLFDPARAEPSLLAPGDEVRFRPIGGAELGALAAAAADGTWTLAPEGAS